MSDAQKRSYQNLSPLFCISADKPVADYKTVFGNDNPVILEIGFGAGSATAELAEKNPGINYLGIEVFKAGIGRLLWEIEKRNIKNIKIMEGDAVGIFCNILPKEKAYGIHIFFPDPWPKKRHHKRRLVTRPFTDEFRKCLGPDGYVYMVTDWQDYADWALAELSATQGLVNKYEGFAAAQEWRPQTRFETKGLDRNHKICELYFVRENG